MGMEEVLAPAIELGEKGFPVSEIMGYFVRPATSKEAGC
jgi:gamma-glutamyltranspeptidase